MCRTRNALVSFSFLLLWLFLCSCDTSGKKPLYILALVPFADNASNAGWSAGLELLPAGRLAVQHINEHLNMLQGYELKLIEADTQGCALSPVSTPYISLASHAFNDQKKVVGVVGLPCSAVAAAVSPVIGRNEVSLLQMSMGNSPVFRDKVAYPHLWRVVPSSLIFVEAVLSIMQNRTKISVFNDEGVYFSTTANMLISKINDRGKTITYQTTLGGKRPRIVQAIEGALPRDGNRGTEKDSKYVSRIIFASVTRLQTALLMCTAYKNNYIWPGYLWIFHSRSAKAIVEAYYEMTDCTQEELTMAFNGTINLEFQLQTDNDTELVSGIKFSDYLEQYNLILNQMKNEETYRSYFEQENYVNNNYHLWANVMYDEVWSLAFALNNSIPDLLKNNYTLEQYGHGKPEMTNIIQQNFKSVDFSGAIGSVIFDTDTQEGQTPISVFNSMGQSIGSFDPNDETNSSILSNDFVPSDDFMNVNIPIPIYESIIIFIIIIWVTLLVTINLSLFISKWKRLEIKATSPGLSLLIFIGCYIVCLSTALQMLTVAVMLCDPALLSLCIIHKLLNSIGVGLIFGTVLVKLARVYRIFSPFSQMGDNWNDRYLAIAALIYTGLVTVPNLIDVSYGTRIENTSSVLAIGHNLPRLETMRYCTSKYPFIWFALNTTITFFTLTTMAFFAYSTRKTRMKNFKDTKKINFFILFCVASFALLGPTYFIVVQGIKNQQLQASVIFTLYNLSVPLNAQVFLFVPKVFPLLFKEKQLNKTKKRLSSSIFFSYF